MVTRSASLVAVALLLLPLGGCASTGSLGSQTGNGSAGAAFSGAYGGLSGGLATTAAH